MKVTKLTDAVLFAISPELAKKRVTDRINMVRLQAIEQQASALANPGNRSETRWRGASQVIRSMSTWRAIVGSGRTDTPKAERDRLSARSHDAYRNHLVARAAITRARTNIVGTGLAMQPDVDAETLELEEEEAEELNQQIAAEWRLYYDNATEVDVEATMDGAGAQALALVTSMLGGDCFALTPFEEREGGHYGLKLQLIDPARVSNPNDGPDTATLQDGVEISATGAPIAIHIRSRHPADNVFGADVIKWTRTPIFSPTGERRVFHIWNDKDRIGTTRGVSWLAPILEPLQQLEQYSRAELMAAVISSMFTVFIKKENVQTDDKGNPLPTIAGQTTPLPGSGSAPVLALGNGAVVDLGPGEDPKFADPTRPNANYDPFFMSIVRTIGAALEIPIDELLLSYQSSYSAARAAMLQAWRFYSMRRWWLVQQFCQPHYRLWFDEAVARGRIKATNYADPIRRAAYQNAMWIGPARGAMQEGDEVAAARARVDAGFSNETIETAQITGEDWRGVYRQRRRELERRRKDGMELGPAPGQGAQPGGAAPRPGSPDPTDPKQAKPGMPDNPEKPSQDPPADPEEDQ